MLYIYTTNKIFVLFIVFNLNLIFNEIVQSTINLKALIIQNSPLKYLN